MAEHDSLSTLDPLTYIKHKDESLWKEITAGKAVVVYDRIQREQRLAWVRRLLDEFNGRAVATTSADVVQSVRQRTFALETLCRDIFQQELPTQGRMGVAPQQTSCMTSTISFPSCKAVEQHIRKQAYFLWESRQDRQEKGAQEAQPDRPRRRATLRSSSSDMDDWCHAETYFALDVLDGRIQFPWELGPEAYVHLERVWLEDVKRLRAYLRWESESARWDPPKDGRYYLIACEEFRRAVLDSAAKVPRERFAQVEAFINGACLRAGKVDTLHCVAAARLLDDKTRRIREVTRQRHHEEHNREFARNYLRGFYENIARAVLEQDANRTAAMLKAMTHGDACWPRWQIVNVFEAALVMFFLDTTVITKSGIDMQRVI